MSSGRYLSGDAGALLPFLLERANKQVENREKKASRKRVRKFELRKVVPPLSTTRTTIVRTHSALRNAKATASDKPPERKCSSSDNFSPGERLLVYFCIRFRTSGVVVSRGLRHFLFPRRGDPPRGGLVSLVLRKVKSV